MSTQRDGFASTLGALAATLGSAVGLGNIWKFPYLTGSNGGAAFVLTYLVAVALVGVPVMAVELAIGRRMRASAVRAYRDVVPGLPVLAAVGWAGVLSSVLIMAFYTDVAGWVFATVARSVAASVRGVPLDPTGFVALASGTWEPVLWQAGVLLLACAIIAAGVSRGIERVTRALMPLLLGLLLLCDLRALTLPGAWAGVSYLFAPDLSRLTGPVLLSALGLAFFKLSLGMGTMTTYGSYLPDQVRLVPTAARVALADTLVSLLAGLAIFPAVFALGGTPAGGPGLLFLTIPRLFAQMPMGGLFTTLFFVLAAVATIGAMVSLVEVPVAVLVERGVRRPLAAAAAGLVMLALGAPATLSRSPGLGGLRLGDRTLFDLFDFASSNLLLPLGGLCIAVIGGWLLPRSALLDELTRGHPGRARTAAAVQLAARWLAPVLIALILLSGLGVLG
ncbi:MAG: sodium-dependent transporter [Anaeromyxobacter sp.]